MSVISFEQLAPLWWEKIKDDVLNGLNVYIVQNQKLDMREWDCCIVGEAWKFSGKYSVVDPKTYTFNCPECHDFASQFFHCLVQMKYGTVKEARDKARSAFEDTKEDFTYHFKNKHI